MPEIPIVAVTIEGQVPEGSFNTMLGRLPEGVSVSAQVFAPVADLQKISATIDGLTIGEAKTILGILEGKTDA